MYVYVCMYVCLWRFINWGQKLRLIIDSSVILWSLRSMFGRLHLKCDEVYTNSEMYALHQFCLIISWAIKSLQSSLETFLWSKSCASSLNKYVETRVVGILLKWSLKECSLNYNFNGERTNKKFVKLRENSFWGFLVSCVRTDGRIGRF